MNKIQFLRSCKSFLLMIVKHRRQLLFQKHGKPATESMVEIMALIEHWVPQFDSFDRIVKYIQRTKIQNGVREIIPSKNTEWFKTFDNFLIEAERLQQPGTQLKFNHSRIQSFNKSILQ